MMPLTDNPTPSNKRTLRGNYRAYAWLLAALFLLLYLLPAIVLRLPGFESWNVAEQVVDVDYIFTTPHINADIIILGESSAFYGLDPRQITASLGVKTVNLANTLQTVPVITRLELDRYLSQNKRPRLLVFYLTPWDMDFFKSTYGRFDGEQLLLRHGSFADILRYTLHHPTGMLAFPFQFYAANSPFDAVRRHWPAATNKNVIRQQGHAPLGPEYLPLPPTCAFPARSLAESGHTASIDAMLQRYRNAADQVILYVAPIPHCAGYQIFLNGPWQRLDTAPPQVLPTADFGDDTYYAHPRATAVPTVTQQLTHTLQQDLHPTATPAP